MKKTFLLILSILLFGCTQNTTPPTVLDEVIQEITSKEMNGTCEFYPSGTSSSPCFLNEIPEGQVLENNLIEGVSAKDKVEEINQINATFQNDFMTLLTDMPYETTLEKSLNNDDIILLIIYTNPEDIYKAIYFYNNGYIRIVINRDEEYYFKYDENTLEQLNEIFDTYKHSRIEFYKDFKN